MKNKLQANAELDSFGKLDPREAAKKLQQLQEQFVGGEQVGNEQLKQRRMKKLNDARTKTEKLAGLPVNILRLDTNFQLLLMFTRTIPSSRFIVQRKRNWML